MGSQLSGELVVGVDCEILRSPPAEDPVGPTGDRIQIEDGKRPPSFSSDQAHRGRREAPDGDHTPNGVVPCQPPELAT